MVEYFRFVSEELQSQLNQVKTFIKKHNPTIGIVTEEILRAFLRTHLPKSISVEQGFILNSRGEMSRQCDILIYDSQFFAPFYRINDIVVIPAESVISMIEVKTSINKVNFHKVIDSFKAFTQITDASVHKHLFIYNSPNLQKIESYFFTYKHNAEYQSFDHGTYHELPDSITGINESYHLRQGYVVFDRDSMGYLSYSFKNENDIEFSSLELFFSNIYHEVEDYQRQKLKDNFNLSSRESYSESRKITKVRAIELFDM